jgi:mitogen-activated protein kinase kinase kinase
MAPESVRQTAHTSKVDIWGVGCVTIEMLTTHHPFHQLTPMQALFTVRASMVFDGHTDGHWQLGNGVPPAIPSLDITEFASDFLRKTFELDYSTRPSATVLMDHPWLAETSRVGR